MPTKARELHTATHEQMAAHVLEVGRLGIDVLDYLVATRLELFDFLRFQDDGSVASLPITGVP